MTDDASPLPPPVDFRLLVHGFVGQAFVALGKIPHPMTGETAIELPWARYFIDLLGMLAEKTKGNLSPEEHGFLESQLDNLRLNYVDVQKSAQKPKGEVGETPDPSHDRPGDGNEGDGDEGA